MTEPRKAGRPVVPEHERLVMVTTKVSPEQHAEILVLRKRGITVRQLIAAGIKAQRNRGKLAGVEGT